MYHLKFPVKLLRFALLLVAIAAVPFIQSCSDDDDPGDTTPPEISFTNLTANGIVRNTVEVELESSDDLGLSSIEVYVGDELIATLTEPPYGFSWDSNQVPDGPHTIKVIATDKSGNKKEAEVTIVVQNTLLSMDIPADFLHSGEGWTQRAFLLLSDEDGKAIAFTEISNGVDVALKAPEFNGEHFYLTEIMTDYEGDEYTWVRAFTWPQIERGSHWVFSREVEDDDDDYVGTAEITGQNPKAETNYDGNANGEFAYFDAANPTFSIDLRKSPSKLFVNSVTWNGEEVDRAFGFFQNIVAGNNTINLNLVNNAFSKTSFARPEDAFYTSIYIRGYPEAGNSSESYAVGFVTEGEEPGTMDVYYPGNLFPSYYTTAYLETPELYFSSGTNSFTPNFGIPTNEVSITYTNAALQFSVSGDIDFATTRIEDETGNLRWIFALPVGNEQTIPAFEIPVLLEDVPLPLSSEPRSYYIYQFQSIDGYEELKEFVQSSTTGTDELYDHDPVFVDTEYFLVPDEGRVKSDPKKKHTSDLRTVLIK